MHVFRFVPLGALYSSAYIYIYIYAPQLHETQSCLSQCGQKQYCNGVAGELSLHSARFNPRRHNQKKCPSQAPAHMHECAHPSENSDQRFHGTCTQLARTHAATLSLDSPYACATLAQTSGRTATCQLLFRWLPATGFCSCTPCSTT